MNTSLLLAELGDLLDNDPQKTRFPDAMLMRTANRQLRGLFRTLVQSNKEYSNFTMGLLASEARELFDNVFEYRLPTWVTHIVRVWHQDGAPTVTPTDLSPYRWSGGVNVQMGRQIPKYTSQRECPHWSWEGNHTLRLNRYTEALDLLIEVAVRPAPMFKAQISTAHADLDKCYLPPSLIYGEFDLEEGSFINSAVECTTTADLNATNYGRIQRVVYSTASAINGGSRLYELTFDGDWASVLEEGDVIESIVPLPDEHCRLLVLKTAQAAFGRKPNVDAMRIVAGEMSDEMGKFIAYATTPRDRQGPSFIKSGLRTAPLYNPDRPWWGWM